MYSACVHNVHLMCVNFGVKSTHFDRKTTRFDLQNQIPTHFQTISPWGFSSGSVVYQSEAIMNRLRIINDPK